LTATHSAPLCWITLPGLISLPLIFMKDLGKLGGRL